jgi:hypothetical protein
MRSGAENLGWRAFTEINGKRQDLGVAKNSSLPVGLLVNDVALYLRRASTLAYLAGDLQGTSSVAVDSGTLAVTHRYFDPYGNTRGTAPPAWPEGEKASSSLAYDCLVRVEPSEMLAGLRGPRVSSGIISGFILTRSVGATSQA